MQTLLELIENNPFPIAFSSEFSEQRVRKCRFDSSFLFDIRCSSIELERQPLSNTYISESNIFRSMMLAFDRLRNRNILSLTLSGQLSLDVKGRDDERERETEIVGECFAR